MARWTQYIGLSKEATEFLSKNKVKELSKWEMTMGICSEPVYGTIYEVTIDSNDPEDCYPPSFGHEVITYAEVEDVTPWSSGPMIHTALRNLFTGQIEFKWKEEDIHYD
jgi:hypothetical protein